MRASSRQSMNGNLGPGQGPHIEVDVARQQEEQYPLWWTGDRLLNYFCNLPENGYWNSYICVMALMGIVWVAVELTYAWIRVLDILYNVSYAVHVFGLCYSIFINIETYGLSCFMSFAFLVDIYTFSHYLSNDIYNKLACYYIRLHRPFRYLWELNDSNLKGSVVGTALKFCYIFMVLRVTWALVWLNLDELEQHNYSANSWRRALKNLNDQHHMDSTSLDERAAISFLASMYLVNKMFIPIGPSVPPANDIERVTCLFIMLSGCLVVTASAIASLCMVISIYMRPEETFRDRYRLMIKEMKESRIPPSQRDKVETFYKMYWHEQRAVSATQLLPLFPPTLPATIYADIYFEATQKCLILRELPCQFLSELAKRMETIHYIPGDAIIKRSSMKSDVIFITYGDVELVTAEDDQTAILRLTRGTILSQCGPCAPAAGRAALQLRAATFCTAHLLRACHLWRAALNYGTQETRLILGYYNDHMEKVKLHYRTKVVEEVKYKSSILHFKRCLTALKEAKDANGNLLLARTDYLLDIAGCYFMRNRVDANLSDEADAICLRPTFPCILQPNSSLLHAWNFFLAILITAVVFIHPYYLVFTKTVPIGFRFFDYIVTGIFTLDLIAYISTGAHVEEGVPITLSQTSSQQIRSHWFVFDLLGTLPLFEFIGTGHFAGLNKILRLPKVFRVLKGLEDECMYRGNVLRFLSYTLLLLIACYLIAALQQGFMCFQFEYCVVTNLTHSPYWEHKPLDEETLDNRIFFALYWAISMITFTTHMETWGTENWNNILYTLFVLEICIVLRIFMEAVYSATILVTTALREDYDACISIVKNFLIKNQVDPLLRQRFINYLQLCWYTDKAYAMTNKRSIFYDLPPHVYQDIVAKQRSKYMLCIPFMKYVDKELLKEISSKARPFYTSPNEILVNTGDICSEVFVIKQGICAILSPDSKKCIGHLHARCHFGVIACLLRIPAFYTIRPVTTVQVFSISRKHLLRALQVPHIRDTIDHMKTLPEYKRLLAHREPFVWYEPPEPTPNMQRFKLPRKHEPDAAFLDPFYQLGFLSILRYIFPRFTIRPDGAYLMRYEWFRAVCAFTSAMVYPSYSYLVLQWPWLFYLALFLDYSAYFDILQRMLVGYYNEIGILVYHPASTAAHYIKGAFWMDLFGCLALENLETPLTDRDNKYKVTQTDQILMLNRLLQLYRLPSSMLVLQSWIERRDIIIVIQAIPLFMVLLNVFACFMVLYSVQIYSFRNTNTWLIVPLNDDGGSWIDLFKNQFHFNMTETPWNLHLATYFWTLYEISTTGYNCFNPSNVTLIQILFFGMLLGAMIITYFSVRIISIRANVNKALAEFQEHLKDITIYMKRERLPSQLQKLVLDYYEYNWDKMGGVNYRAVFKLCDQVTLRTDAILHIYGPTFAKCPVLSRGDVSMFRIIGRAVHGGYFLRGMSIVEACDVISDMYFIDYGCVEARVTKGDGDHVVRLSRGSVFGNLDGEEYIRCTETYVATSRVHLLMINSKTFHGIISDCPVVKHHMRTLRPDSTQCYIEGDTGEVAQSGIHQSTITLVTRWQSIIKYLYLEDRFLHICLITVSLLCVYLDVYNAGFQDNRSSLIIVLYILDACFLLKIIGLIVVPFITRNEDIKRLITPTRKAYFKGQFKWEVLSVIPFELLSLISAEANNKWLMFSCLRLNRMLRIVTVYKGLTLHQERMSNLMLFSSFSVFIWFTMFVHITSCAWHFIGFVEDQIEPKSSWIYKDNGTSWCDSLYICSLYFVLTTFTQNGVGDILPKKHTEVIFVCILQIISAMIYMVYVGEISNIIQYQSFRSFSFYTQYLELQEFLKNNRMSRNLVEIVNRYCLHLWRESRGIQEPHFLRNAPHALRLTVMSAAYIHHLNRHHVFENCEPEFLRQLVGCLKLFTYNENMHVVKSNEITDSMYLIHTGKVEEIPNDPHKVPRNYPAGSYFGVIQGLTRDTPFNHSYRTLLKSQVLTLHIDDWFYLLTHFPRSRDVIAKHIKPDYDNDRYDSNDFDAPRRPKSPILMDENTSPTLPRNRESKANLVASQELLRQNVLSRDQSTAAVDVGNGNEIEMMRLGPRLSSHYSQSSVTGGHDDPEYVEESTQTSPFIEKMTETAKKLIGISSKDLQSTNEMKETDVLLIEEEKAATEALLEEIAEIDKGTKERRSHLERYTAEDLKTVTLDHDEHLLTVNMSDIIAADVHPVDDSRPGVSREAKDTQQQGPSDHTRMPHEMIDEATSTSKLRRMIRVRYEDDNNNSQIERASEETKRNLHMLDSDMQLAKEDSDRTPLPDQDAPSEESSTESLKDLRPKYS